MHVYSIFDMTLTKPNRELYEQLVKAGVIRHASDDGLTAFTLKSGKTSAIYLDARRIISHPQLFTQVVHRLYDTFLQMDVSQKGNVFVCGVPSGAVPFASLWGGLYGFPQLMVRNQAKAHGTSKLVEGDYTAPADVILVEDVVTTGGSVRDVQSKLNAHGLRVVAVVSVFYRGAMDDKPAFTNDDGTQASFDFVLDLPTIEQLQSSTQSDTCLSNHRELAFCSELQREGVRMVASAVSSSKLCIAIDLTTKAAIRSVIEAVGPHVGLIKLHCDIVGDFDASFVDYLLDAKRRHGLLIWEDRKFGDIGATVDKQLHGGLYRIAEWADIVSCHAVGGQLSLPQSGTDTENPGPWIVLIGELSCQGQLLNSQYTQNVIQLAQSHHRVVGIVCQQPWPGIKPRLTIVPGIKPATTVSRIDGRGQQYSTPASKAFADVLVVGRAVTQHETPSMMVDALQQFM